MALGLAKRAAISVGHQHRRAYGNHRARDRAGPPFPELTADLRKIDAIPDLLDRAVAEFGHIDILVNNAGLIRREDAINFSERDWDDVMNLNIKKRVLYVSGGGETLHCSGNGGKIINIASMLSFEGASRVPSTPRQKAAVMGVTRLLGRTNGRSTISTLTPLPRATWRLNNTQQLRADESSVARKLDRILAGR